MPNHYITTKGQRISKNSNTPEKVAKAIYEISAYETIYDKDSVHVIHPPEDVSWVVQLLELGGYHAQ